MIAEASKINIDKVTELEKAQCCIVDTSGLVTTLLIPNIRAMSTKKKERKSEVRSRS